MTSTSDNIRKFMKIGVGIFPAGGVEVTPAQKSYYLESDDGLVHGAAFALRHIMGKSSSSVIPGHYDSADIHLSNEDYIWLGGDRARVIEIDTVLNFLRAHQNQDTPLGLFGILPAEENAKIYAALLEREKLRQKMRPTATALETPEATND